MNWSDCSDRVAALGHRAFPPLLGSVAQQPPRCGLGALPVDERRDAVDDHAVIPGRLLNEPPLAGRVVPGSLEGKGVYGIGIVDNDVGRGALAQISRFWSPTAKAG